MPLLYGSHAPLPFCFHHLWLFYVHITGFCVLLQNKTSDVTDSYAHGDGDTGLGASRPAQISVMSLVFVYFDIFFSNMWDMEGYQTPVALTTKK